MRLAPIAPRSHRGFTLLELMVVLATLGILAAVAYPSYTEYLRRGWRAEAQSTLLDAAQFMQRFYAVHDRYDRQRDGTAVALPDGLRQAPPRGSARYDIVVSAVTPTSYTLEARPAASNSDDACGVLILNALGQRQVRAGSRSVADCWR